jgi:hypothetical protein
LLLPGCDSNTEPQSTVTVTESASSTITAAPAAPPETEAAAPARPAGNQCVRVDPAPDGRYQV